jgi:hypothetical protein
MKFICSKIPFVLSCIVLALMLTPAHAQKNNNFIYSRFGLGSLELQANPQQLGMGGTGVASLGQHGINTFNPASMAYLPMTTFQAAGGGMRLNYSYNDEQATYGGGYLKNVALGFRKPGSKWGFAISMQPYSFVNYEATTQTTINDTVPTSYSYYGEGGLNKAALTFARKWILRKDSADQKEKQVLSIGLNTNYIFGTISHSSKVGFPDQNNYEYAKFSQNHFMNGFVWDIGLLYSIPLSVRKDINQKVIRSSSLNVGITYGVQARLNSKSIYLDEIISNTDILDYPLDTTFLDETVRFKYAIPQQMTAGISYHFYGQKLGDLQMNLEYMWQDWSGSKLNIGSSTNAATLGQANRLSAGIAFTPENSVNTSTLRHCTYRLGYYQGQTYWKINDQQISEQGITAGLSIPILKSLNKLHLGAVYLTQGNNAGDVLKTQGLVYQIGFTFIPREPWFFQRKYD